jgi:hypothetical protein
LSAESVLNGPAGQAIQLAVQRLSSLPGIAGIALGGSRARGTGRPDSDIDLGLFYIPGERPDFDQIMGVATELDDSRQPMGGGSYGEWGPWMNGGVWLKTGGFKTDILLRDCERVKDVLQQCVVGKIQTVYQVGHPHAFVSSIYAGEVYYNIPLFDPRDVLAELHGYTDPYPDALADGIIRQFGWEAGFSLSTAEGAADGADAAYVTGCAFRAVACMVQVLHATNHRYLLNEKGGVRAASQFPNAPREFQARVDEALAALSPDPEALHRTVRLLTELKSEVDESSVPG